jgi:type IV secretory pathway TrbD component
MSMPQGWVVPATPSLSRRQTILGLPRGYAALLVCACLFLGLSLDWIGAALYLLAFGWGLGKLVTFYDPFAWDLLPRVVRIPPVLHP